MTVRPHFSGVPVEVDGLVFLGTPVGCDDGRDRDTFAMYGDEVAIPIGPADYRLTKVLKFIDDGARPSPHHSPPAGKIKISVLYTWLCSSTFIFCV